MRRTVFIGVLITSLLVPAVSAGAAGPGGCDFDGDGRDDLAVGAPLENVSGVTNAGAINVMYGTSGGLSAAGAEFLHRGSTSITDSLGANDSFGQNSTCGDFDNDGDDDLVVGLGADDVGAVVDAGSVHVIYGSSGGLSTTDEVIHQDTPGIQGTAEASDQFGGSVAAGDFDNDSFDDLAIGTIGEDYGAGSGAGTVTVIYGSSTGLGSDDQVWHQDSAGIKGTGEPDDNFGNTLGVGDFDGDGADDLTVGSLLEDVTIVSDAGAINVIYGSATGLTDLGDQAWSRDTDGIEGSTGVGDRWSSAIGVGDFNGDGRDDIAVGAPQANVGDESGAGSVNVIYGSATGLTDVGDQVFDQDTIGIGGIANSDDLLGLSLAGGDFDNDDNDDLAIAVPLEDLDIRANVGMVLVIYGSGSGLTASRDETWHQDIAGIKGVAETFDFFGYPMNSGDFNGDGRDDLVAGVTSEDLGSTSNTGAVAVLYGSAAGVSASDQLWDQSQLQLAEANDLFGYTGGGFNLFLFI